MSKTDGQGKAAGPHVEPKLGPKPARAPQRRLPEPVERIEAPKRPARAVGTQLAEEVARLEHELKRSLAHVKRYGASAALIYLDLDGFKRVNDRHGHAAGDAVLKAVAMVLDRHSRESDVVARVGGDEFVLLLWNCSEADAQAKAQMIEAAIARMTPTHAGAVLQVGASCGVTMLLPLDRPQDLLDRADRAMYARKLVPR